MKYNEFINRMRAELAKTEDALIRSQVVDYRRHHVAIDDTVFDGFLNIINTASSEAEEDPDDNNYKFSK